MIQRLPAVENVAAKFMITKVFPSPEIEDETAINLASLLIKFKFDFMFRIDSEIRDLGALV